MPCKEIKARQVFKDCRLHVCDVLIRIRESYTFTVFDKPRIRKSGEHYHAIENEALD